MNQKANELNLTNTHFVTPNGLDSQDHYTTAYELVLLTDYALNNIEFAKIVNTKTYTVTINGQPKTINNTNELLGNLNGVNGVKTGFTNNAGRCLVTSTTRNNWQIITVVLGADTKKFRTKDSISLIEYAFKNYELVNIQEIIQDKFKEVKDTYENSINIEKGIKQKVKLKTSEIPYTLYPIKKSEKKDLECTVDIVNYAKAPIEKDDILGSLELRTGEKTICSINIICEDSIPKKNVFNYFSQMLYNYGTYITSIIGAK